MWISPTEIMDWQRCRRQWGYHSANAMSLVRKGIPNIAFNIGTALHVATEAQALSRDPIRVFEDWAHAQKIGIMNDYASIVGTTMGEEELSKLMDSYDFSRRLITNYFGFWGHTNPIEPYEYVHPEVAFRIPIPGTNGHLVGTMDGIAINPRTGKGLIVERKTYADTPKDPQYLQTDPQIIAYTWAYSELFGELPEGVIYDGIRKAVPQRPAVLKSGKGVSKQWILTTPDIYREAIADVGGDPADYTDILAKLDAKNSGMETMFHTRRVWHVNGNAVYKYGERLPNIYDEMERSAEWPEVRYPTFTWQGCWDCHFTDLCNAEELGGDFQWISHNTYQVGTYGTQANQRVYMPQEIGTLEDLKNAFKEV